MANYAPMRPSTRLLAALVTVLCATTVSAQWLNHPTPGIPRLDDGTPDLHAPVPRTPDGKPDISGLWMPQQPFVVGSGPEPGVVPFKPWAEELWKWRFDTFGRDDPAAYCIVGGVPRVNLIPYPFRIISVPGRVVVLYEIFFAWREIMTDGRSLPIDPTPTWMGYSVGQWEADAFVVRSSGYNGRAWLDTDGRPTSDALKVTERFRRKDFGHMDLEITVDDVKTYTAPWTIMVPLTFQADTELLEYVCNENNKYQELLPKN
jgi:hypothetical protein